MTRPSTMTWGDELVVALFHVRGGLNPAVARIRGTIGPHIGTRNTFAKLLKVTSPDELDARDQFRAWLVLTALGEDPGEWGIPLAVVPRGYDVPSLQRELQVTVP